MEKNINIKYILISVGATISIMMILFVVVLTLNKSKPADKITEAVSQPQDATDDMASMHAPPPPADNTKFQSLVGNSAPNFELTTFEGKNIKLSSLKGKKVVLFFSEGAMCAPSCWDQMKSFANDVYFKNNDVEVLTVVVDDKKTWADAVNKDIKLTRATVLLDTDKKISQVYGTLTVDSSMHRGNYPGHSYIVLDREGVVKKVFDDPNMGVNNLEIEEALSKIS